MKVLQTSRLLLRPFHESDAEDVFEYARRPNVGPAAGWKPHVDIDESHRIVQMFIEQDEVWAIVDKAGGHVIGSLGLHRDDKRQLTRSRMIGYVLSEAYWGRGLAAEAVRAVLDHAFDEIGLEIVCVVHFPFNTQSKRVIEKCGFRYEGVIRMATPVYTGEVFDDVCYSMTRAEHAALRQA